MKRVALITGGGRGIGLGIGRCLAAVGFNLVLCGRRDPDKMTAVLKALSESGSDVIYVQADIGEAGDRDKLITAAKKHFGALHVLVNNAGIAPKKRQDLLQAGEESYDAVMRVNLKGPYFLTQLAANWMIAQAEAEAAFAGCIVNISSISAVMASPNRGEYCLSKAGLSMATKLWSVRLAEFGIPVYEIRPGIIKSDMTQPVTDKYDKLIDAGLTLEPRWGTPEDVGKATAALVRGDLPYATGAVIPIDGGVTVMRLP